MIKQLIKERTLFFAVIVLSLFVSCHRKQYTVKEITTSLNEKTEKIISTLSQNISKMSDGKLGLKNYRIVGQTSAADIQNYIGKISSEPVLDEIKTIKPKAIFSREIIQKLIHPLVQEGQLVLEMKWQFNDKEYFTHCLVEKNKLVWDNVLSGFPSFWPVTVKNKALSENINYDSLFAGLKEGDKVIIPFSVSTRGREQTICEQDYIGKENYDSYFWGLEDGAEVIIPFWKVAGMTETSVCGSNCPENFHGYALVELSGNAKYKIRNEYGIKKAYGTIIFSTYRSEAQVNFGAAVADGVWEKREEPEVRLKYDIGMSTIANGVIWSDSSGSVIIASPGSFSNSSRAIGGELIYIPPVITLREP